MNVASRTQALSVTYMYQNQVTVNVTGEKQVMKVGDAVIVPGENQSCQVILRQIDFKNSANRRAGFDVNCTNS